jgi:hypothetical protein
VPSIAKYRRELTHSPQHPSFAMAILQKSQTLHLRPYTSSGIAYPSIKYTYDKFIEALHIMAFQGFGAYFQFFWGE